MMSATKQWRGPTVRIEVAGLIASGKTTFAEMFSNEQHVEPILENFTANPFLEAFYADPQSVAFETEVVFLLLHAHQQRRSEASLAVCDFSIALDRAYADVTLASAARTAFDAVLTHMLATLDPPKLIIHLQCSVEESLRRVRLRGREVEARISREYLQRLDLQIQAQLAAAQLPILEVNSESTDFRNAQSVRQQLIDATYASITPTGEGHCRRDTFMSPR